MARFSTVFALVSLAIVPFVAANDPTIKLDGVHDLSEEENQSCGGTVSSGAFVRGARGCLVPRVVHCMRD